MMLFIYVNRHDQEDETTPAYKNQSEQLCAQSNGHSSQKKALNNENVHD